MQLSQQYRTAPMCKVALVFVILVGYAIDIASSDSTGDGVNKFPKDFWLGTATSSYQIEGGWDADGKGESIWDHLLHTQPNFTLDGRNADVAADSYNRYKEDVEAVDSLGSNMYRFSISWPRILPTGDVNNINRKGIKYYNKLIDSLLARNITPLVTMYHWDLPYELQKLGGWPNPVIVESFADYAELLFIEFGDRVKWWITFNEPSVFALGYSSTSSKAPAVDAPGIADYLTADSVLKAHARAWHVYDEKYRAQQNGKVGIALSCEWEAPATNSKEDAEAAATMLQFNIGLWAHPIFSKEGDYPKVVRERVDHNSRAEGRTRSRLPHLTTEDVRYIRGTADFLALTHYSSYNNSAGTSASIPSLMYDTGADSQVLAGYPAAEPSLFMQVVPWGIRKILNWLSTSYPGYPLMIVENGRPDDGSSLEDNERIAFLGCYMSEVLRAVHEDGVNVTSYLIWSTMDNLEWQSGFTNKFGLIHVDFDDAKLPRTRKASFKFVQQIYESKTVPLEYFNADTADLNSICYTAKNGPPTGQKCSGRGKLSRVAQQRAATVRLRMMQQRKALAHMPHGKSW